MRLSLRAWIIGLVVVCVCSVILAELRRSRSGPDERSSRFSLNSVTTAQWDFRSNDRDGNGIHDFWVADVSGLFRIRTSADPTGVRLIEHSGALADARPLCPPQREGPWRSAPDVAVDFRALEGESEPANGYWYVALQLYEEQPGRWLKYDDGSGRNRGRFGVCAYPARHPQHKLTFMVSEENALYAKDTAGVPPPGFPLDPEADGWRRIR